MEQETIKKGRDSNIELLRILAILLIIISHISWHGYRSIMPYSDVPSAFNEIILRVSCLGNVGSVIFVMISGYFLCNSNKIDWNRLIRLVLQVLTYSLLFYFSVYILFFHNRITPLELFKAFTPVIHKVSWFYTTYILLYLAHPYLNKLIKGLEKNEFRNIILGMFILFSLIQTFFMSFLEEGNLVEFIFFYFIGAYIRINPDNIINKYKVGILLSMAFIWFFIPVLLRLINAGPYLFAEYDHIQHRASPVSLLMAASLLCCFLSVKIGSVKWINVIASAVGGVYLIDDNIYIRPLLYEVILPLQTTINSNYIAFYILGFAIAILIVCTAIEIVRKNVEKVLLPNLLLNKLFHKNEKQS